MNENRPSHHPTFVHCRYAGMSQALDRDTYHRLTPRHGEPPSGELDRHQLIIQDYAFLLTNLTQALLTAKVQLRTLPGHHRRNGASPNGQHPEQNNGAQPSTNGATPQPHGRTVLNIILTLDYTQLPPTGEMLHQDAWHQPRLLYLVDQEDRSLTAIVHLLYVIQGDRQLCLGMSNPARAKAPHWQKVSVATPA